MRERSVTNAERQIDEPFDHELYERLVALPERQRLAVFLRYYADLSYEDIARVPGVRTGTVAVSLHAARRALRDALTEEVSA